MRHSINAQLTGVQVDGGYSRVCGSVWLSVGSAFSEEVLLFFFFWKYYLLTYIAVWFFASENLNPCIMIIMVRTKSTESCRKGKQMINFQFELFFSLSLPEKLGIK